LEGGHIWKVDIFGRWTYLEGEHIREVDILGRWTY